ncbi:hypothetical protein evm_014344 [Chilo suppressalis]|nr:hypothetical protein evm_014344 [Chilo suppressalis]
MSVLLIQKSGEEIRCGEWHPTEASRIGVVYEGGVSVHDVTKGDVVATTATQARARQNLTGGKWNPHQGHTQFAVLQDMHIKCYDTRTDCTKPSWSIDNAHKQLARDLDFNPNRYV